MLKRKKDILLILSAVILVLVIGTVLSLRFFKQSEGVELLAMNKLDDLKESEFIKLPITGQEAEQDRVEDEFTDQIEEEKLAKSNVIVETEEVFDLGLKDGVGLSFTITAAMNAKESSETLVETVSIPFEIIYDYSDQYVEGYEEISIYGANGSRQVTYKLNYLGDELVSKEEISSEVVAEPVHQVVLVGTYVEAQVQTPTPTPAPTPVTTPAPTIQETEPPAITSQSISNVGFVSPGSVSAAVANYNIVASMLNYNGNLTYNSFVDNGDGTITVDGVTFAVSSGPTSYRTTYYDGYECAKLTGIEKADVAPNGLACNRTSTGILGARGVISKTMHGGGLPYGTVVFVEGYGLGVIGDCGNFGTDMLDLCLDAGEIQAGVQAYTGNRNVYIISIP